MKRLLVALVAAVAVSTVFAKNTKQGFEENKTGFVAVGEGDESDRAEYGSATKPSPIAGLFDTAGDYFLDLDTGDATLWATNSGDAAYFDMNMQFNPCATAPEVESGTKIAVYLDTANNLVVISGPGVTTNVTSTTLNPGTWGRLTVAGGDNFKVYLDGVLLGTYPSLTGDASVKTVGFKGSGALDNFVARTTDPFLQNPAATIDGEGYASYTEALAEALAESTASATATITIPGETPKTMDGSENNPYAIALANDLLALQNAVLANPAARSLNFVQTANIDMTGVTDFYGIGWFDSSTSFASVPTGVASNGKTSISFAGTYDGQGYTISNVTLVRHNYAGVFNNVSGTVKNLTVQDIGFSGTCSEWGCAIVGNAASGSLLENLTAVTSSGFNWGDSANHNVAGVVVRPIGAATIRGCVNNANISATAKRVGGIASFVGSGATGTVFDSCTNNAALVSTDGTRGVGGILGCAEGGVKNSPTDADTIIRNCVDFGSETAQGSGGHAGAIVGSNWNESYTYTDGGGNTFLEATGDCGYAKNAVFGRVYAIEAGIDGGNYLTTVAQADLAAGNTYVLLADVAASETPVFTLEAVGDTIAFNTNGYVFAGTVAAAGDMVDAVPSTVDAVITYTATEAPTVATITKNDVTTPYRTLQDAITAAESGDTVDLVENAAISGEVNIPANVTVVLASGVSLDNVTALSGTGVLFVPSGTLVPLVQTNHAASLLRDAEKWAGTLFIKNATMTGPDGLAYYGNANSTVRFENVWLNNYSSSHAIGTLELVGAGVYIQTTSGNMTLPCALVGDGSISLRDASDTQRTVLFSGDVSAFAGNVTVATDTKSRIVFGTNASTQGNNNCIVVDSGASVTVAEGKTWTAPNGYVIKGTATVSGTLAAGSEKVYGAGCVIYTSATAAAASAPIAGSWTGTCVVGWAPTGAFNPNTYGNANSTVVLSNDLAASAYFGPGSATTLTINPTVRIAADVEIKNGYSKADDSCLVTFTKLTGDHKFSTSPGTGGTDANPTTRRYAITTLDNFTGSLKVKAGSELRIATVNVADGTNLSGLIIPAECDAKSTVEGAHADGVITGALALTVAGEATGKTLTYDADGADGAGLYVKASAPVTPIDPAADTPSAVVPAESAKAAIEAVEVTAPAEAGSTAEEIAAYKDLFDFTANETSEGSGVYTVTMTGIKEEVKEDVSEDAVTSLVTAAEDSSATTVTVDVPAGLYYKVTTYDTIGGTPVDFKTGISSGSTTPVTKPTSATQGFIKVEMGTKSFNQQ